MNFLIIDVETHSASFLRLRLSKLASTIEVRDGGKYREDQFYSQVHVATEKTESEMDDWLYSINGVDYVGAVETTAERIGMEYLNEMP